jgi:IS6 family transposase
VLFKWSHFERANASNRDVAELVIERGLPVHHTSIWRWVQQYAPELNKRWRRELRPPNGSWRVDETYTRVAGAWTYLYRAPARADTASLTGR